MSSALYQSALLETLSKNVRCNPDLFQSLTEHGQRDETDIHTKIRYDVSSLRSRPSASRARKHLLAIALSKANGSERMHTDAKSVVFVWVQVVMTHEGAQSSSNYYHRYMPYPCFARRSSPESWALHATLATSENCSVSIIQEKVCAQQTGLGIPSLKTILRMTRTPAGVALRAACNGDPHTILRFTN